MLSADRPGAPASSRAAEPYDLLVIGSGFGGAMAAAPAVMAGRRVVMIEAGDWVARGPDAWTERGFFEHSPSFNRDTPFDATAEGPALALGTFLCVGRRLRVLRRRVHADARGRLRRRPDIVQDSGAEWPYTYADLEPFYSQAEALLQVAGSTGEDPTEPPRSAAYPQPPAPLASDLAALATPARELGLHPFRLPLAINYLTAEQRAACQACSTC
jgi:choline dehydrogenase-like flavoprotein